MITLKAKNQAISELAIALLVGAIAYLDVMFKTQIMRSAASHYLGFKLATAREYVIIKF